MKMRTLLFFGVLIIAAGAVADPIGTSFTYQGELMDAGVPANGTYDLQFELYDVDSGGAIVGSAVLIDNQSVENGIFSVELDFGTGPFAGDQLWLAIRVRDGSSSGGFTDLLPRQKVTAAPYALHAEMVAANAIAGAEIANNSIGAADIAPNAVGSSEINSSQVQQRVGDSCAVGAYITAIGEDGSVVCTADGIGAFAGVLSVDDQGQIGVSQPSPLSPLSVGSGNNWFWGVGNGRGDLFVGDDEVGLSFGVALDGLGRGAARMWTKGGVEELFLGSEVYGDELALRNGRIGLNTGSPQTDIDLAGEVRVRGLAHGALSSQFVGVDQDGDLKITGVSAAPLPFAVAAEQTNQIELTDTFSPVLSVDVTASANGKVTLNSMTNVFLATAGADLVCAILRSTDTDPLKGTNQAGVQWFESQGVDSNDATISGTRQFDIAANSTVTFELRCAENSVDGGIVFARTMTAIYTPAL